MIRNFVQPAPGNVCVVRDRVEEVVSRVSTLAGGVAEIVRPEDERAYMQKVNPWALVVGVGASRRTQYGTTIDAPCAEGDRVLIAQVGKYVELRDDNGETEYLYVLPFEGVSAAMRYRCTICKSAFTTEPDGRRCPSGCKDVDKVAFAVIAQ